MAAKKRRSFAEAVRVADRKRGLLDEAVALVARRYADWRDAERRAVAATKREQLRAEGEAEFNATDDEVADA